ncbi:MAG: prevent-host-death protein [Kiritimatiellae bacterium]|nr:prevent-host-death protein [Kiritimatiellia bacterium]
MPTIKPISELRNYPDILKDIGVGSPVFLTKNGTGRYVILDIEDYAIIEARERLSNELIRGRISGEVDGWIGKEAVRSRFAEKANG